MSVPVARWLSCLALALAAPAVAGAQEQEMEQAVLYRCTDAAGHVTFQNDTACPPGTRQQRRLVDVPPALPAYVPREQRMPAVVAAEQARDDQRIEDNIAAPVPPGERKAPPPLYQCTTWDQSRYFTERAEPRSRCAPLQVVGIAGRSPAASACEKVADQCSAVPEAALCGSWRQRVDEAEFRWKFAGAAADDERRLQYEQLRATYENSTCKR